MKRYIALLLVATIAVGLFSGCGTDRNELSSPTEEITQQTQPSETTPTETVPTEAEPQATEPAETQPTETQATEPVTTQETKPTETVPTETQATEPEQPSSYLQPIKRATQSIFDGPGYDYSFAGSVEVAGTYTIVEEAWDGEGNLWGKLKSGAGWVNLTEIRSPETYEIPISVNFAPKKLISSGNYQHCIADASEYMVQIVFYADETLKEFSLVSLQFSDSGFEVSEMLFHAPELPPDTPLVADVAFPGDMTTYGISFTDGNGNHHHYYVSQSGRNGALELYEPAA